MQDKFVQYVVVVHASFLQIYLTSDYLHHDNFMCGALRIELYLTRGLIKKKLLESCCSWLVKNR